MIGYPFTSFCLRSADLKLGPQAWNLGCRVDMPTFYLEPGSDTQDHSYRIIRLTSTCQVACRIIMNTKAVYVGRDMLWTRSSKRTLITSLNQASIRSRDTVALYRRCPVLLPMSPLRSTNRYLSDSISPRSKSRISVRLLRVHAVLGGLPSYSWVWHVSTSAILAV